MITIFDGENTITYSEWDLLKEHKMTPTEIKAKEKAEELINSFTEIVYLGLVETSIDCAIIVCDETINALNNVKGMGKIHKVKFWKLVKENLIK